MSTVSQGRRGERSPDRFAVRPRAKSSRKFCAACAQFSRTILSPIAGHCRQEPLAGPTLAFSSCAKFYPRAVAFAKPGDLGAVDAVEGV